MKKILLIIILLSTAFAGKTQNLVPNGNFEGYSNCPTGFSQLDSALNWITPSQGSSDYYNQCSIGTNVGVPVNGFGYQYAHSGEGYSGICLYYTSDYRENLEVQLTSPLVAGACYHFEMYVCAVEEVNLATDTIGVYFSNTYIFVTNTVNLPYTPQIKSTTGFMSDTANWTLISGNYTAVGGENYLLIGNFNDNNNSDTIWINQSGTYDAAYVFIDDVSLTPCTVIEEQNQNEAITIYPNPVKDELFIKGYPLTGEEKIKIYDVIGKEVYRSALLTSDFLLPTSNFQKGIYFIEINNGKEVYRKKFLKE